MIFDKLNFKNAITESSEIAKLMLSGSGNDSGSVVTTETAMRVTAVYACINVIAESLAQLPLTLYNRNGRKKEPALSDNLYRLLHDAPNDFQTSFDWRLTKTALLCLKGNAYSFINRSQTSGEILELLPMHPDKVKVTQNKDYSLNYIFTDNEHNRIPLRQDQVFRLTGLSFDGVNGISPIEKHRQTIGIALSADRHSALSLKNGSKMSGVLSHPGHFKDPDVRNRVAESWQDSTSGNNAYKTAVLEDGLTWTPISMTNKDAQYIEARKFQIEDIARIFNVPPHKIGHLEKATNNNIEHQGLEFVVDTMMPWFVRWEQAIARDLLGKKDSARKFAKFNVAGLLRGDSKARAEFYASGIQNLWLNPNEVREHEDMNPREGGDKYINPNINTGETANA